MGRRIHWYCALYCASLTVIGSGFIRLMIVIFNRLTGVTIVQGWIYVNDNKDSWFLRGFVFLLIATDIFTTGLDINALHRYLIVNFGDLAALQIAHWEVIWEYALTVVLVFMVQLFFVSRIWLLRRDKQWIPAVISFFAVGSFVSGMIAITKLGQHPMVSYLMSLESKIAFGTNGGFAALVDIMITSSLTWSLATSKSGIKRTDTMLQKLLMFVVSRGLLVSVTQVLFLITYVVRPDALWWVPLHFMCSKLYVITMVAMLNGRGSIRGIEGGVHTSSSLFNNTVTGGSSAPKVVVQKTIELSQFREDDDGPLAEDRSSQRKDPYDEEDSGRKISDYV
ncbi:hypothetical protein BJ138DRAFT_216758 [Hygrophoropsis aurantiaca]|uniref:Uncharacterized protein n=1 Tax=Hygrophoropsis aurantiaca TaxID=72124 RepID=A0ACB8A9X1_9AGAM|nr:hypothetical protein BJ138DRAFT_216758 [Hygrophoropsis aurantiaca]